MPYQPRPVKQIMVYVGDLITLQMGAPKQWAVVEYVEGEGGQHILHVKDLDSARTHKELMANIRIGVMNGSITVKRGAASAMLATPLGQPIGSTAVRS